MFLAEIWKISEFLSENFQFLVVKFSIYLNRDVFYNGLIICLKIFRVTIFLLDNSDFILKVCLSSVYRKLLLVRKELLPLKGVNLQRVNKHQELVHYLWQDQPLLCRQSQRTLQQSKFIMAFVLTLTMLWANSADDKQMMFYIWCFIFWYFKILSSEIFTQHAEC